MAILTQTKPTYGQDTATVRKANFMPGLSEDQRRSELGLEYGLHYPGVREKASHPAHQAEADVTKYYI